MNTNEKQISMTKDLMIDTVELRKKIEDYTKYEFAQGILHQNSSRYGKGIIQSAFRS